MCAELYASAPYEVKEYADYGKYQQNVDERAYAAYEKSENPADDADYCNDVKDVAHG